MGLDMYLHAKKFNAGGYEHNRTSDDPKRSATVREYDKILSALHMTRAAKRLDVKSVQVSLAVGSRAATAGAAGNPRNAMAASARVR